MTPTIKATRVTVDGRILKQYNEAGPRAEALRIARMWADAGHTVALVCEDGITRTIDATTAVAAHDVVRGADDPTTGAWTYVLREAHEPTTPATISDLDARRIAAEWHGGGGTALYAFASTGAINTARKDHNILYEIMEAENATNGPYELNDLRAYIYAKGPRGPVAGWSDLTW